MKQELSLINGGITADNAPKPLKESPSPENMLRHFRNITSSMTGDALRIWAEIYGEFHGAVTCGTMITADARKGFHPRCGWPEFLERFRLLAHYLDHLKRLSENRT